MIFHITTSSEWESAQAVGAYEASSLVSEGFIHLSELSQVVATANLRFAGVPGLVLLCVDEERIEAELKREPSRGGELFPHVYGPLNLDAVVDVLPLAERDGSFVLPQQLA